MAASCCSRCSSSGRRAGALPPPAGPQLPVAQLRSARPARSDPQRSSARRFLLFDAAWCAFAAFGLLSLLQSRLLDRSHRANALVRRDRLIAALALWGAGAVALSSAALPPNRTTIPFAESGFGDGLTCLGCVRSARSWQHELEDGRMVILFDSDLEREDRTAPGGLWLYGRLVALTAGHEDRFLEYYPIVSNFDHEQPRPGFRGPVPPADIAGEIGRRVAAVHPRSIVWWFSQPTAWERTLARSLAEAGGSWTNPDVPSTALADHPSAMGATAIRVETPAQRWSEALARSARSPMRRRRSAVSDSRRSPPARFPGGRFSLRPFPIRTMARPIGSARAGTASRYPAFRSPCRVPWASIGGENRMASTALRRRPLGKATKPAAQHPGGRRSAPRRAWPLGRNCVARMPDGWWTVDPVERARARPRWTTRAVRGLGLAIGLVPYGDRLVVAASDQHLHVVDPASRRSS